MKDGPAFSPRFMAGVLFATLLFVSIHVLSSVIDWLNTHSQPEAFFEFLATPMFSLLDIIVGLTLSLMLFIAVTAPKYMPRP